MNCSRCGKLIGENTMGTILPLCQCAWQQSQNTFYVQDQSAEIESLRKQVAELTNERDAANNREAYESGLHASKILEIAELRDQLAAMTKVIEDRNGKRGDTIKNCAASLCSPERKNHI